MPLSSIHISYGQGDANKQVVHLLEVDQWSILDLCGILPPPKQSPFSEKQSVIETEFSQLRQKECSTNQVTITMIQGR